MRRLVICNPAARAGRGESAVDYVAQLLRGRRLNAEIVAGDGWESARDLARQAAAEGYEQVVAAGGDGTVNAVANGLSGAEAALGLLPLGTGNILAHNLGLARLSDAVRVLAHGTPRQIDLGYLNDRAFVSIAGVGFDAEITQNIDAWWQQAVGRLAFVGQALISRFEQQTHVFRVRLEGEDLTVLEEPMWSVLIMNVPEFTFKLPLARDAVCDDGWLDVAIFRDSNTVGFLYGITQILGKVADLGDLPGVSLHRIRSATIETDPAWLWEVDGDTIGPTPVTIETRHHALKVLTE